MLRTEFGDILNSLKKVKSIQIQSLFVCFLDGLSNIIKASKCQLSHKTLAGMRQKSPCNPASPSKLKCIACLQALCNLSLHIFLIQFTHRSTILPWSYKHIKWEAKSYMICLNHPFIFLLAPKLLNKFEERFLVNRHFGFINNHEFSIQRHLKNKYLITPYLNR